MARLLATTVAALLILAACGEYEGGDPHLGGGAILFGFTPTPTAAPPPTSTSTPTPDPRRPGPTPDPTPDLRWTPGPTPTPTPSHVGLGLTVFLNAGCTACHMIDGVPEAIGEIGPNLSTVASTAGSRVDGLTAEQYLWQSVSDPSEHLVDGYDNLMPAGLVPDQTDFDNLIAYLLTLE